MPTYPLHVDDTLWDGYKQSVPSSQTRDEPIITYIAERVLDDPTVDDEKRRRAAEFLDREHDTAGHEPTQEEIHR